MNADPFQMEQIMNRHWKRITGAGLGVFTLLLAGCGGSSHNASSIRQTLLQQQPDFSLTSSANNVNIPTDGSASIRIVVARKNGLKDAIQLSVVSLPAGIHAQGNIAEGANSGLLVFSLDPGMGRQSISDLVVQGVCKTITRACAAHLSLTIVPTMAANASSPNVVQATGHEQETGSIQNSAIVSESSATTVSTDSTKTLEVRSGFTPSTQP